MTPREAFLAPQEVVAAEDAVGRVAAESLAAYPPGIPNVLPGERLTAETLEYVQRDTGRRRLPARGERSHAAHRAGRGGHPHHAERPGLTATGVLRDVRASG